MSLDFINDDKNDTATGLYSPRGVSSPTAPGSTHFSSAPFSGEEVLDTQPYQRYDHDIDDDVRQSIVYEALRKQLLKPSPQMDELLTQIYRGVATPIDRAFATRRKNACGALKILAAKKENRLKICWTSGVLLAMTSVLQDVQADNLDEQNRVANIEARNRIVSVLCNLALEKKNHLLIASTPGLLDSMAQTILLDENEGRQGCCTVMFYLSKTADTKAVIARNKELMASITKVIEVPTWIAPQQPQIPDICRFDMDETIDTYSACGDMSCTSSEHGHNSDCSSVAEGRYFACSDRVYACTERVDEVLDGVEDVLEGVEKVQEEEKLITFTLSYEKFVDTSEPLEIDYDLDPNKFLHGARLMAFASLLCLVKNEETVTVVGKEHALVEALLEVSLQFSSPSHVRALAILAHMTRHPQNCHLLVHKHVSFLSLLQEVASDSPETEGRRYALCALQNLSVDASCRTAVASTPNMMKCLVNRLKDCSEEETVAAMAALQHLADDPANLNHFIAAKNCISFISVLARSDYYGEKETGIAAFLAKNTLATLSHWIRRIATSGSGLLVSEPGGRDPHILHDASLQTLTYEGWS
eukprot:CAMPEP_0201693942 /NCGR_PEP_ID=MMETSP0578-20130828/6373_1 /ASSEMBLY_ACC=CAM_ASM_000663 /TAXON_ID=267565 /ORGANISM="Skeletonema grethea, Strain CCMP 1804" /LENGTH=586 /DNA_ID=CAMNT_0048179551 /DNA_START=69 /DNA_END=1829 /DNA_ORIENTATION=+